LPFTLAQESNFVVVNSGDWRDVYLGLTYASLKDIGAKFMMSEKHSALIPNFISINQEIELIESRSIPYVINYKRVLESEGYEVSEYKSEDITKTNLYLAGNLDVKNFIILDDSYGYNAVSIAPYAILTNAFVLFANEENIRSIDAFLGKVKPDSLILYGELDQEVIDALAKYETEIIHKGNRFANNIEIAKRYIELTGTKQALLTNGEFIEAELISGGKGKEPAIFIGQKEPPEQVIEFLKTSTLETGILVGNEYFDNAKNIKDRTGLNVFVKFAQSSATGGEFQKVEGLDRFPLPSLELGLSIESISYNTKTQQLEIIYKNDGNVRIYAKSDIGISADGTRIQALGDKTEFIINEEESKGQGYTVDLESQIRDKKELEASYFIRYGESPGSLEMALEGKFPISVISKEDICDVRINKVSFDKGIQRFLIEIENLANQTCYVRSGLSKVMVSDEEIDLEDTRIGILGANEAKEFRIKQRLDEVDIEDNRVITAYTVYGSREEFLVKLFEQDFDLELIEPKINLGLVYAAAIIIVLIVLGAVGFSIISKKKKHHKKRK
jgi:hypothetical protein